MKNQQLETMWDHFRQMYGVGLRCVQAVPADKLDSKPIAGMRTPRELVVHLCGTAVKSYAESVVSGRLVPVDEKAVAATLKTRDDLVRYARACWEAADKAITRVANDAHLQSIVRTPWGMGPSGAMMVVMMHDEFAHHRGQLYAYLRAMGVEPPKMWDFDHNEASFAPRAVAAA